MISELSDKLAALSKQEKLLLLGDIFEQRGKTDFLNLARRGVGAIDELVAKVRRGTGSVTIDVARLDKTVSASMARFRSAMEKVGVEAFRQIQVFFFGSTEGASRWLISMARSIASWGASFRAWAVRNQEVFRQFLNVGRSIWRAFVQMLDWAGRQFRSAVDQMAGSGLTLEEKFIKALIAIQVGLEDLPLTAKLVWNLMLSGAVGFGQQLVGTMGSVVGELWGLFQTLSENIEILFERMRDHLKAIFGQSRTARQRNLEIAKNLQQGKISRVDAGKKIVKGIVGDILGGGNVNLFDQKPLNPPKPFKGFRFNVEVPDLKAESVWKAGRSDPEPVGGKRGAEV